MSSKHSEPRSVGKDNLGEAERVEDTNQGEGVQPPAQAAPDASGAERADTEGEGVKTTALLEAEIAGLREELSAVNDKYLRKLADDVNFRKRMAREKEEGQRYAVATLLADLVPVLDDFDRAIASAEVSREYAVLHDGVALIRRQLGQMLEGKYGLKRFSAINQPFDPNRHEAVAMTQAEPGTEGASEAIVEEEFLPGYGLHDRILRTAKVRVRMPAPAAASEATPGSADSAPAGDASGSASGRPEDVE